MTAYDTNKSILFLAEVMETKDPRKLGRVQVKLNNLDKPVEMPWIRVLQSQASNVAQRRQSSHTVLERCCYSACQLSTGRLPAGSQKGK